MILNSMSLGSALIDGARVVGQRPIPESVNDLSAGNRGGFAPRRLGNGPIAAKMPKTNS